MMSILQQKMINHRCIFDFFNRKKFYAVAIAFYMATFFVLLEKHSKSCKRKQKSERTIGSRRHRTTNAFVMFQ